MAALFMNKSEATLTGCKLIPKSLDSYGFLWISYGFLCIPMDSYGIPMDSHGFPWIPMDFYGFLWIPMNFYEFLWIPMDSLNPFLLGFLWIIPASVPVATCA